MKNRLMICFVTFLSLQANDVSVQTKAHERTEVEEMTRKLKQAHQELKTLRAQLAAILTVVLEELEDFETTRGIDFSAWNNLQDEYEKQHAEVEDAEEAEGEQE